MNNSKSYEEFKLFLIKKILTRKKQKVAKKNSNTQDFELGLRAIS